MGVDTTVVLCSPIGAPEAISEYFNRVTPPRSEYVYLSECRIDGKVGVPEFGFGIEALRAWVESLPWKVPGGCGVYLQVAWMNDYTLEDDSMYGREAPLSWHHEVWSIPGEKVPQGGSLQDGVHTP